MSIATEIQRLQQAKTDIKTAIEAKGVAVADTDTIDTYASKIVEIEGGGTDNALLDGLISREITSIENTTVTYIGSAAFQNCTQLTYAKFTEVLTVDANAFNTCSKLAKVDFSKSPKFTQRVFAVCSALTALIIRGETVSSLTTYNVLDSTPIKSGTGFIYVPDNLVDSYKSATNWSTFADQIKGISELEGVSV